MLRRYKVTDCPNIAEVIKISDLEKFKDADILLIRARTQNEDELNDLTDQIGAYNLPAIILITNFDTTVHEVVEKLEKGE